MRRRTFLAWCGAGLILPAYAKEAEYPLVTPRTLVFPRDHGSHPDFRTEWWYITGWLGDRKGFQLTFFRNRPGVAEHIDSAFAPKQLLFAHAALSDAEEGRLLHDQRIARAGFDLAEASISDTHVWLDEWRLQRDERGYTTRIVANDFAFELQFRTTQPLLLQGNAGLSRKGPRVEQASYYYSVPHLSVSGEVKTKRGRERVEGVAWLDHEWSSEYLAKEASGWDWTGLNFDDGAALMAFRIRAKNGAAYWAGGAYRSADGTRTVYAPEEIRFEPLRQWRSPHTDTVYPVAMRVHAGTQSIELVPLMDDQELDSRSSTGTIYWEGAVRAIRDGAPTGRGYLELTGYWQRVQM